MRDNNVPEGFRMTEIGLVPEGWEVVKLEDLAETYTGGTPKRDKEEYWNG